MVVMDFEVVEVRKHVICPYLKDSSGTCLERPNKYTRSGDSTVSTVNKLWSGDRKLRSRFSAAARIFRRVRQIAKSDD
jgi:hypothetical protein